uniref:Double-stranded RNA-binding protein 4 isoform X3 n=1 Tax=Elaeis guineensis var. tenera TaxID=51953 RepID=A0A6I9REV9_ELAGV|nr:double-stranded RNA-binding protein 4 isoform X3 [Elaeis guineensis]
MEVAARPNPEQFMHKNRLQEYAQRSSIPLPIYQTVNEGHPHAPQFRSTVLIDGVTFISSRTFPHRKEAEQDVAKLALEGISRKIKDEGIPLIHADTTFCKSILHEYAVKMSVEKPTYTTSQLKRVLLPSFISSLVFDGKTYTGAAGRSKKEAEQIAARAVIQSILGQQARNDSNSSAVKGKEIQATSANDDLAGVANQKQLLLGHLPAAAETKSLLEAKKPKEEYPCEQSFGPIGNNTSPPVLAQGGLPSGLKSRLFESSDASYQAEQNQVNDLAGPSMQSYDAQYGVPRSQRKRSRKKQKGGHQHKKARTELLSSTPPV